MTSMKMKKALAYASTALAFGYFGYVLGAWHASVLL